MDRDTLAKLFDFKVEFHASGVRREDGKTAAEVEAERAELQKQEKH